MQAQKEKEARVEQLAQKAMKRIANQGIIRGFTAWQDLYLQAARQKRMLAAARRSCCRWRKPMSNGLCIITYPFSGTRL